MGDAFRTGDGALAADVALQLAHGEGVLRRPHRSGLTAASASRLAARLAGERGDAATLERLTAAASERGDEELAAELEAQRKLAANSRGAEEAARIPVEATTVGRFAQYKDLLEEVRVAAVTGDSDRLDELERSLGEGPTLPAGQIDEVRRRIAEARSSAPVVDGVGAEAIRKLAATSRGGIFGGTPFDTTPFDPDTWDPSDWRTPGETPSTIPVVPRSTAVLINGTWDPVAFWLDGRQLSLARGEGRRFDLNPGDLVFADGRNAQRRGRLRPDRRYVFEWTPGGLSLRQLPR